LWGMYKGLCPCPEVVMAEREVLWFIMAPVAEIRAVSNAALPMLM
jgi:hypothetical protein